MTEDRVKTNILEVQLDKYIKRNNLQVTNKLGFIVGRIVHAIGTLLLMYNGTIWLYAKLVGFDEICREYYLPMCISVHVFIVGIVITGASMQWLNDRS